MPRQVHGNINRVVFDSIGSSWRNLAPWEKPGPDERGGI